MNKTLSQLKVYCEFEKIFHKGMATREATLEICTNNVRENYFELYKRIKDNLKQMKDIITNKSMKQRGYQRWPQRSATHGGAYASLINIKKNKGASGLNIDIYRHNPLRVSEII